MQEIDFRSMSDDKIHSLYNTYLAYGDLIFNKPSTHLRQTMCRLTEEFLLRQAYKIARSQFLLMDRTGDFGLIGKDNIAADFYRVIFKKHPNCRVNNSDMELFREWIKADNKDIESFSLEELKIIAKHPSFKILGNPFGKVQIWDINRMLGQLGSGKIWFDCDQQGKRVFFFWGWKGDSKMRTSCFYIGF